MTKLYFILAVAGWAWLVLVAVFLVVRLAILQRKMRGFDVVQRHDEVPSCANDGGSGSGGGAGVT